MTWFVESPWPGIGIATLLAAALAAAYVSTRQVRWLLGVVGAVLLGVVLVLVERWVETDREVIARTLDEGARAVEKHDVVKVLSLISPSAEALRTRAQKDLGRAGVAVRVDIKGNLEVAVQNRVDPPVARATFNVVLTSGSIHYPTFLEVKLRREAGQWRVYDYTDHGFGQGLKIEKIADKLPF